MSRKQMVSLRVSRETEYILNYLQEYNQQSRTNTIDDAIQEKFYNSFIDVKSASDALDEYIKTGKVWVAGI